MMTKQIKVAVTVAMMAALAVGYAAGQYAAMHRINARLMPHAMNADDHGRFEFCKKIVRE